MDNGIGKTYGWTILSLLVVAVVVQWRVRWRGTPCTPPPKRGEDSAATRWTAPAFSGRLPGVAKSGLKVSEWVRYLIVLS